MRRHRHIRQPHRLQQRSDVKQWLDTTCCFLICVAIGHQLSLVLSLCVWWLVTYVPSTVCGSYANVVWWLSDISRFLADDALSVAVNSFNEGIEVAIWRYYMFYVVAILVSTCALFCVSEIFLHDDGYLREKGRCVVCDDVANKHAQCRQAICVGCCEKWTLARPGERSWPCCKRFRRHEEMTITEKMTLVNISNVSNVFDASFKLRYDERQCPVCKIAVTKISGCSQLHCRCGAGFCWVCGQETRMDYTCSCYTH